MIMQYYAAILNECFILFSKYPNPNPNPILTLTLTLILTVTVTKAFNPLPSSLSCDPGSFFATPPVAQPFLLCITYVDTRYFFK